MIGSFHTLWAAALVASMAANLGLYLSRVQAQAGLASVRAALAAEQADRERERASSALALAAAAEQARQTETQWRLRHQEVQTHAESQLRAAAADAARARSAADVLRKRAEVLGAQCITQRDEASRDPAAALAGASAGNPGVVLADLLGRLAQTAGELAAVADARGAAGVACEQAYDALMPEFKASKPRKPPQP